MTESPPRLERWTRHPVGVAVRILAAACGIFYGGVTIVVAAINYSSRRAVDAPWTERALESGVIALIGLALATFVLVAARRPTSRRLLALGVVLVAIPLLTRTL